MECPKCQKDDILVEVREDEETYICIECRTFWDEDMEVLGEISKDQLTFYQDIIKWNTLIDGLDFQLVDTLNIERCIFCKKIAVKNEDDYVCHSCGGSWSVT